VTTVGDVPVHVEYFKDADGVAREKSELVRNLKPTDLAILNRDDERVFAMHEVTKGRMISYGFDERAKVRVSDFEYRSSEEGVPLGVTFKLHHEGSFIPVHINGSLGKSQAWAAAGAAAVGLALGMNLVNISQAIGRYHGPKGRLKIVHGLNGSNIIDDTYNASPASTRLALNVLEDLPALRKIAILGDMLELGEHTIKAHEEIGKYAATVADVLICIGARAKFIADAAETMMNKEKILTFETSGEAALKLPGLIREHDLILVKSSQGIRTEKIVKSLMADPSEANKLLVRQSKSWLSK
jgi:UDP-N-acetylmuramoyl-tripeptide--D-alanyl-D-alanine ligase